MSRTYGDLGATYGAHTSTVYGTLFDSGDVPQTGGYVQLFARVQRSNVNAEIAVFGVRGRVTSLPVTAEIS